MTPSWIQDGCVAKYMYNGSGIKNWDNLHGFQIESDIILVWSIPLSVWLFRGSDVSWMWSYQTIKHGTHAPTRSALYVTCSQQTSIGTAQHAVTFAAMWAIRHCHVGDILFSGWQAICKIIHGWRTWWVFNDQLILVIVVGHHAMTIVTRNTDKKSICN